MPEILIDWCVRHAASGHPKALACDVAIALSADPPAEGCQFVKAKLEILDD